MNLENGLRINKQKECCWSVPSGSEVIRIEIMTHNVVIIDKLYGPLSAENLRIYIDRPNAEWVIERENNETQLWEEKARWDCQESYRDNDIENV